MVERILKDGIFHIHTIRCKHASDENDEEYVKKAIEIGAKQLIFTDHVPFPGDPFINRMDYSELNEYIDTLYQLKMKYEGTIDVGIGFEVEYLPSYRTYFEELAGNDKIEYLIVGQHFYEHKDGTFSLYDSVETKKIIETRGQMEAMIEAAQTGLFKVIAHPDRSFRKRTEWTEEMDSLSRELICACLSHDIVMEQNYSSMRNKTYYWNYLWQLAERIADEKDETLRIVRGYDAHSTWEMENYIRTPEGVYLLG